MKEDFRGSVGAIFQTVSTVHDVLSKKEKIPPRPPGRWEQMHATPSDVPGLSELELFILETEDRQWRFEGFKLEYLLTACDLSGTRYYQLLNQLIDKPEALPVSPMTVNRLRRLRRTRLDARSARKLNLVED